MTDLLHEIAQRLQVDYAFKPTPDGKHLRKGRCPNCASKSLWTFAASPWVVRCERLNHCGYEAHAKDLYSDLFESWSERARAGEERKPEAERNPHAAADAYLQQARGFDLALIQGLYTQEQYFDQRADRGRGAGTATVRFAVAQTWWERLIDRPARFGKKKANFKYGGSYGGHWWSMPSLGFAAPDPAQPDAPAPPDELWLVEGIFDAIALAHHGIAAVALMSCNNYPGQALAAVRAQIQREGQQVKEPRLVFALDSDKAGREYTLRHVRTAQANGWRCTAAQIPAQGATGKLDWNDLHLRDRLTEKDFKEYRHQGALLVAESAIDKALLIYHHTGRTEFDLDHGQRLYWFKLDLAAYSKAKDDLEKGQDEGDKHLSICWGQTLRSHAQTVSTKTESAWSCRCPARPRFLKTQTTFARPEFARQDMFEEIEIALQKVKRQVLSMQMNAGPKAREAFHIHSNMERNYVKLKMLEAMAAVPQEFSNALALAVTYFGKDNQIDFVLQGLLSQAKETGEKEDLPFEDFSVAPFTQSDFNWTPLQIRNANKALEGGADINPMKSQRPAHSSFAAKGLIPAI